MDLAVRTVTDEAAGQRAMKAVWLCSVQRELRDEPAGKSIDDAVVVSARADLAPAFFKTCEPFLAHDGVIEEAVPDHHVVGPCLGDIL